MKNQNLIKYKKYIFFILLAAVFLSVSPLANAADAATAEELTASASITASDGRTPTELRDGSNYTRTAFSAGETLHIQSEEKISGIYIIWHKLYGTWTLTAGETAKTCGTQGFLHEYVTLDTPAESVSLTLPQTDTAICEIHLFSEGTLPDWVQVWNPPCERADLMLLSTHSDDEQLFFLGVLPYYAGELGLKVQVVYMTNHWDTDSRPHEQLNGLWTVGVRNYPIIGPFPDDADTLSRKGEAVSETLARALQIYGEENLVKFQTEMIRRFRPQVIVAHDLEGEYHHGAHMVNTFSLQKALEQSNSAEYDPDSAQTYGLWDVPKTYIHLWPENQVTMNWDLPLSKFNGKTAYEVSKLGYACHESQQWTWFTKWIQGEGISKASDIAKYSPCRYGLYRTTVGSDTGKNDFMENITPYPDPTPEPTPSPLPTAAPTPSESPAKEEKSGQSPWLTAALLIAAALLITLIAAFSAARKKHKR